MPLVSDNWTNNFTWNGIGPMPAAEEQKLRDIVATGAPRRLPGAVLGDAGQAGPARDRLWSKLVEAGVDHINTDDLHGLQRFLSS